MRVTTVLHAGWFTVATFNIKATNMGNNKLDVTNLATKADLNTKTPDNESKIPDITYLAAKTNLSVKATEIENEIPYTASFIATPKFNKLTKISVTAKMKDATKSLVSKSKVYNAFDKSYFDLNYLSGWSHWDHWSHDIMQNYLFKITSSQILHNP